MTKLACTTKNSLLAAFILAATFADLKPLPAQAANLVVNGDFNNGLTGFTSSNTLSAVVSTNLQLTNFAALNNISLVSQGVFSQTLSTIAGQNYQASFDLLNLVSTGNFDVFINSTEKLHLTSFVNILNPNPYTFSFVGTGSDTIAFKLDGAASAYQLDNVVVSPTSVPEPFTIIGTLVGSTAALRMRKKLKLANK
jgi:hypothetical protein